MLSAAVMICALRVKIVLHTCLIEEGVSLAEFIWALMQQNLSSGFPTKRDPNQSAQVQRLARKLKFHP